MKALNEAFAFVIDAEERSKQAYVELPFDLAWRLKFAIRRLEWARAILRGIIAECQDREYDREQEIIRRMIGGEAP